MADGAGNGDSVDDAQQRVRVRSGVDANNVNDSRDEEDERRKVDASAEAEPLRAVQPEHIQQDSGNALRERREKNLRERHVRRVWEKLLINEDGR